MDEKTLARFWAKVDRNGPVPAHMPRLGPCWVWTASTRNGYGQLTIDGRVPYAHRVGWQLQHGPIPDGLWVLHRCDNPPCVRGSHLHLGDQSRNMCEMVERGRSNRGIAHGQAKLTVAKVLAIRARHAAGGVGSHLFLGTDADNAADREAKGRRVPPRGMAHRNAKVVDADVINIRSRYAAGGVTQQALADEYGVDQAEISRIVHRKLWTHIP